MQIRPWLLFLLAIMPAFAGKEAPMNPAQGKKVVMVVAQRDFRDEEFNEPFRQLSSAGAIVEIASSRTGTLTGVLGAKIKAEWLVREVEADQVDAVIFVGGPGAQEYFHDAAAHKLAREAADGHKTLAAICIAPAILANAGVLKDRQATCFESVEPVLLKAGALLRPQAVVRDGRLVTANGPAAAGEFARAILATLP
jgi:protease I